jgi:hypothetical protein
MDSDLNFFCISNYNNNLDWVKDYPNHIIYDKTWDASLLENASYPFEVVDLYKKYPNYNIVKSSINGYNIYDYLTYIIDHYDDLPNIIVFCKGNTFPRHVSEEKFRQLVKLKCFAPIEDWKAHDPNQPSLQAGIAMFSSDGGWLEINNSWYLNNPIHPIKYFQTYNDFMLYCFTDPVLPKYVRFPPGGNFIVPKEHIYKYDKVFYKNLRLFVEHTQLSGESHLIERALYTIWMCNYEVTENMKTDLSKLI